MWQQVQYAGDDLLHLSRNFRPSSRELCVNILGELGHRDSSHSRSFFLLVGWSAWSPTGRSVLTRPPTGRHMSPALPSDCFAIDFPGCSISSSEGLPILLPLLKGVAQVALYCAHRTSTFLSCSFCEQRATRLFPNLSFSLLGGGLFGLLLRASNEGLLRPRVARARETNRLPPSLDCPFHRLL